MQDKQIPVEKLKEMPVKMLRAIKKAGEKHMSYYYKTMHVFSNPSKRIKTFDTRYYEEVLPVIKEILNDKIN